MIFLPENLELKMSAKKPSYNFLLIGKTGAGKSSTGNTLLNDPKSFETSDAFQSCSSVSELKSHDFIQYQMNVVDTPGIHDTIRTFTETLAIIHEGMSRLPKGFDAILLVLRFGERLTQELIDAIDAAKTSFGELFIHKHCIIVFTFGDAFENPNNTNIVEWCQDEKKVPDGSIMQTLLRECGYKVVLFYNNKTEKRAESVQKVLSYLSSDGRYTNETFQKCADLRNEYVTRMGFPEQRAKIQRDLSLLQNALEDALNQNDEYPNLDDIKKKAKKLLKTVHKAAAGTDQMNDLIKKVEDFLERIEKIPKDQENRKKNLEGILENVKKLKAAGITTVVFSAITTGVAAGGGCLVVAKAAGATLAVVAGSLAIGGAVLSAGAVVVASYSIYKAVCVAKDLISRDNKPDKKNN